MKTRWAGSGSRSRIDRSRFFSRVFGRSGRCPLRRQDPSAAYVLLGDWALAVTVLAQAAVRPEASVLDDLLLALARHHLGRLDEARSGCCSGASGSETVRPTRRPMMRRSKL